MNNIRKESLRYPASRIVEVAKALSGDVRVRILEALGEQPLSVGQLAEALGVAQPTISINVQTLEQAGLVTSWQGNNREKICHVTAHSIVLELPNRPGDGLLKTEEISMPIGMYASCSVQPTCGMARKDGSIIGSQDDPRVFYMPERTEAQLLWFSGAGYVEYLFANPMPPGAKLDELVFSAELCSEAPGFRMEHPSDISLFINGQQIGTWTSEGDFGDRKGKLTPEKWRVGSEYGKLTEWRVTHHGSFLNGHKLNDTSISTLNLSFNNPITVRLEVSENAAHAHGLNLFGRDFGDYEQDIKLSFIRNEES